MTPDSHDSKTRVNATPERGPGGRPSEGPAATRASARRAPVTPEASGYAPPRLLVYGMVRDLTSSGGRIGKNDKAVRHSRTGF